MDPNANLAQQEWTLNQIAVCKGQNRRRNLEIDLTELRQALYDWIREGGFEPNWELAPKASPYFIGNRKQEEIMAKRQRVAKVLAEGNKVATENISGSQAENALLPAENQGNSILSDPPFNQERSNVPTITLKFKGTQKNGIHTYSDESRGASVYVNKSMFGGTAPAELTIEAPEGVFAEPGSSRAAARGASPEKLAKQQEKAQKAQERADKAAERAKKALEASERLKKALGQPAGEQPAQPTA
jgi:hypothetical protein